MQLYKTKSGGKWINPLNTKGVQFHSPWFKPWAMETIMRYAIINPTL
ncbi:MAG: hypothetical protein ACR2GN_06845 [Bacteroidia bacterium]